MILNNKNNNNQGAFLELLVAAKNAIKLFALMAANTTAGASDSPILKKASRERALQSSLSKSRERLSFCLLYTFVWGAANCCSCCCSDEVILKKLGINKLNLQLKL